MENTQYWHSKSTLTVFQAAMLAAGYDPMDWLPEEYEAKAYVPRSYRRFKEILFKGIEDRDLLCFHDPVTLDALISVSVLKSYFAKQGIVDQFFAGRPASMAELLDPLHPHHSKKLAAAIRAWVVFNEDRSLLRKTKPKKAVMKHLSANASSYGLMINEGLINEFGILEVAKVVNWNQKGGAPKSD